MEITLGELTRELQAVVPSIKGHTLRDMCDEGKLPAYRNPLAGAGWWFLNTEDLEPHLKPYFTPTQWKQIAERLGIDVEQKVLKLWVA